MTKITNTFNQGLDRDSSKNKYDNVHYYDAKNMRIITQEGLSGGAKENIRGTQYRLAIGSGQYICGHVVMGDYLIIWTTTNNTSTPNGSSTDRIFKVAISTLEALTGTSTLTLSTSYFHLDPVNNNLIYTGNMGLCTGNLIVAVARYENANIQKVYWVDGYNRLRHINTVYNADTNDLTTMSLDKLEAIGDINLSQPAVVDIPNGNLKSGKIQYTYQLYGVHGAETVFAPLSGLVNLTNYPEAAATTESYRGSDIDEFTGKSVKCTIDIQSLGYTRIRLVAVHYTSLAGEPEIRIVEEREISGAVETIYFTDTGESVGSLLLEDIRTTGTLLFSAEELETKDNILFPANITEESFDVDFDARAYRFGGASSTSTDPNYNVSTVNASEGSGYNRRNISRIYQEDDSYFLIYGASLTRIGAGGTASIGDWEYYNSSGVYQSTHDDYDQSGYGTSYGISTDADAINTFNDLDNDGLHDHRYMYQADGIIPGGEGPNVSYRFKIKETIIDAATTTRERLYTTTEGTVDNPSYYGYASPYNVEKYLGYHRDEIYRFGIVFFDEKGRSSFVKWIGDIRMPSISTLSNEVQYNAGGGAPTPQIGTVSVINPAATIYSITVDGITSSWNNDDGFGNMIFNNVTGIGNVLRNIMITNIGHLASFTANVGGVWDLTFDQTYGQYTVNAPNPTRVTWAQSQAYAAGIGASSDYSPAWYDGSNTIGNILYPEFTVANLPAGVESYQIVRVRRESLDRTVMAQGMVGPVTGGIPDLWTVSSGTSDIHTFASPEVAFNKNLTKQSNDRIQEVGEFSDNVNVGTYAPHTDLVLYNYHTIIPLNNPQLPEVGGTGSALGDEHEDASKTNIVDGQVIAQDQVEGVVGTTTYYINNSTDHIEKGIAFVFEAENTTWRSKNTTYNDVGTPSPPDGRKLINYRRNVFGTQYGGVSHNSRRQNHYIAASEIASNIAGSVNVFGGDTYIGIFDYLYSSWEDGATSGTTQPEVLYFPCETSINLPLRLDDCYHREYTATNVQLIRETAGVWADNVPNEYAQPNDLYRYNTVYSKENDTKIYIQAPFDWSAEVDFPVRTRASNFKIMNEYSDNWLIFGANALKDVDPQWGEITKLINVNEKLMFFQPRAFGVLTVNERALLQTGDISQLSLGVSGILDRYDYAKTHIGASDTRHVLLTANGLYWIDVLNKAMYKYTGGPEEISMMKGMDSFFRESLVATGETFLFSDPEFKEVMVNDYTNSWTLVYNELTDAFTEFNDFYPRYVINYNDKLLGARNNNTFYKHNDSAADRGHLYGSYYDSSITLLINPDNTNVAIFNNMEWLTEVLTNTGVEADVTFDTIQLWNDYQGSISTGITLTPNSNVKRRMRKWRYTLPRATYEKDGVTPKSRLDARFRDTHLFVKLSYTNDANDRRFIAHDIMTSFTSSNM